MAGSDGSGRGEAQGRDPVIRLTGVVKDYRRGTASVRALDGVSLSVERATFVAITGPSGAGKSSLLHVLGGLDVADQGEVVVEGNDLSKLREDDLATFRRLTVGFVFQFFNLMPTLCAWENVAVPALLGGAKLSRVRDRAVELLEMVGVAHRRDHAPGELSGGEMQRVAIARALMNEPSVILADEPTGNLDSVTGDEVVALLQGLVEQMSTTVVLVTHNPAIAAAADGQIELRDGRVATERAPLVAPAG